jgi:outer membrane receptor protein involved in Fe transport
LDPDAGLASDANGEGAEGASDADLARDLPDAATDAEAWVTEDAGGKGAPEPAPPNAAGSISVEPAPLPGATPAAIEVTVQGTSAAERVRQSAEAVKVIETTHAKRETADLGEMLARTEGIGVRRAGGLGAAARFSLNGLMGDQIRFLLDGIPLELSGYGFGVANVPVGFVERVDVYRGVVPVRFGSDALGGAVNLVSDQNIKRSHATAAYQTGSFGTHRLSGTGLYVHAPSGIFTRLTGFLDRAENDYVVDVEVPDERQRPRPASVHRANDQYAALGASAEVGVAGRPWAKLLSLRGFVSDYEKGLPHDVVMEMPYGRVHYGTRSYGASLRYERRFARRVQLQAVAGHALDSRYFKDTSTGIYDWYGRRTGTRFVGATISQGEIETGGFDRIIDQHSAYARSQLSFRLFDNQSLRLALSPNYSTRSGEDRQIPEGSRDPLEARQNLWVMVTGIEYELDLWDRKLENILFAKDYVYRAHAREPLYGGVRGNKDASYHRGGVGDSLRLRVSDDVYLKTSYEWTTRLPRPDEVFGDGMRVSANLDLRPETSHNANLGATFSRAVQPAGSFRADANLFLRDADELITQLPDFNQQQRFFKYQNITHARSTGIATALGWTSPGDYVLIDANLTWQDFRNLSTEGNNAKFKGDRIPNRPWLFANGSVRLQKRDAILTGDSMELGWYGRYVHEFYRGWETPGRPSSKSVVDTQFIQAILLTYLVQGARWTFSSTLELDNIADAKAYDFFGVQRPGRAAYYKATLEL